MTGITASQSGNATYINVNHKLKASIYVANLANATLNFFQPLNQLCKTWFDLISPIFTLYRKKFIFQEEKIIFYRRAIYGYFFLFLTEKFKIEF